MNNKKKLLFWIIVAAQLLVLVTMIVRQENLLANGQKVLLKCVPVDPRSLFSGDYVTLNYDISEVPSDIILQNGQQNLTAGATIYVALEKNEKSSFFTAVGYSGDPGSLKKKYPVVIKGTVKSTESGGYRILYGVEEYFIPQFKGKELEQEMAKLSVLVSVDDAGNSALSRLYLDEKEVSFY